MVSWSLRSGSRAISYLDESGLRGSIIVRRADDTSHVQEAHMHMDHSQFSLANAEREEKEMFELQKKYEKVVKAYNKEVQRRIVHW